MRTPARSSASVALAAMFALVLAGCSGTVPPELAATEAAVEAPLQLLARPDAIRDQYIVVFKDTVRDVPGLTNALLRAHGGSRLYTYEHALRGFAATLPPQAVVALRRNPNVAYIEQDRLVSLHRTEQTGATWGLDRIDQRDLPLDDVYGYSSDGTGVNVYVIDSGILYDHEEFGGRATLGMDFVGDGVADAAGDCDGHGTHVAGTIGGAIHGVAKNVNLISVRVFDCFGSSISVARQVAAIDWVTANHVAPAVVNMSLGGIGVFQSEIDSIDASVAAGVTHVASAGNDYAYDTCDVGPAGVPTAIAVASSTDQDARSDFSNIGPCVDVFAPGSDISSAWHTATDATVVISGTSMAAPHVTGVAALLLERDPNATPAEVRAAIASNASVDKLESVGVGSPNLLLYVPVESLPTADAGGPYDGDEGSQIALDGASAPDADGATLTFAWTYVATTGIGTCTFDDLSLLQPTLTCTDNGTYTVTLTVSNGVDTAQDSATVTVANVAPSVEAGPDDVLTSGATFDFSGTFSDPGVIDDLWAYEIDWGDGTTLPGSTSDQSSAIEASHQVCAPGVATVGLTVTDKDGGMGSDFLELTVEYYVVDIQITPDQNPNPIRLRQRGLLPVAAFSTPTFDATTLDVTTVTLGNDDGNDTPVAQRRNGTYFTTYEDVNGDGLLDLVMQFEVPALVANGDLTLASTELVLLGTMNDACTQVRGSDHVTVVPR